MLGLSRSDHPPRLLRFSSHSVFFRFVALLFASSCLFLLFFNSNSPFFLSSTDHPRSSLARLVAHPFPLHSLARFPSDPDSIHLAFDHPSSPVPLPSPVASPKHPSSPRPVVPHPLRPLPPPPPSSPQICLRCGCDHDRQIIRQLDQPDPSILNYSHFSQPLPTPAQSPSPSISLARAHDPIHLHLVNRVWSSVRDIYCQHPMLSSESALDLLDHSMPHSELLLQTLNLNLDSIKFGLPTQYIFTKTSDLGKTGDLRPDYFRRHIKALSTHILRVAENHPLPETLAQWGSSPRQLMWLIIEDGPKLSEPLRSVLANENPHVPYVYYVYGPTHRYGNAQQNSAYALIHRMVSYLGHGPVLSIDDDGKVLDELFDITWKVKRLGVWPMGNLTPFKWEGPEYDEKTHEFIDWLRWEGDDRPFPVDNGAFAFNSQVLGTTHRLKGPRYWPTDYPGGESEFVSQIISRQDLVEPLCYNCHLAWHNQRLSPDCIAHLPTCEEFDTSYFSKSAAQDL